MCSRCPLSLVRAEIGTLLSTNMLTWQLPQPSISISIAYLFVGVQISSLTVARHRGQLRPGASSRDLPHPPSTLPLSLCVSLLGYFASDTKKKRRRRRDQRWLNFLSAQIRGGPARCSMRVSGVVTNGERALTHLFRRNQPRTFSSCFVHSLSTNPPTFDRMTSPSSEWTAQRVRDTFLDYFKQNGHTFGGLNPILFFLPYPSTPANDMNWPEVILVYSPFFPRRSSVGSDPSFHQCGNEPVQVHLPGHRWRLVGIWKDEARNELAKGIGYFPQTKIRFGTVADTIG